MSRQSSASLSLPDALLRRETTRSGHQPTLGGRWGYGRQSALADTRGRRHALAYQEWRHCCGRNGGRVIGCTAGERRSSARRGSCAGGARVRKDPIPRCGSRHGTGVRGGRRQRGSARRRRDVIDHDSWHVRCLGDGHCAGLRLGERVRGRLDRKDRSGHDDGGPHLQRGGARGRQPRHRRRERMDRQPRQPIREHQRVRPGHVDTFQHRLLQLLRARRPTHRLVDHRARRVRARNLLWTDAPHRQRGAVHRVGQGARR